MSILSETCLAVYSDLCVVALAVEPASLAIPNPYKPARAAFPTAGDFVAYILSSHLAYHVGQLTEWCAAAPRAVFDLNRDGTGH
jgi:hypothetical protein